MVNLPLCKSVEIDPARHPQRSQGPPKGPPEAEWHRGNTSPRLGEMKLPLLFRRDKAIRQGEEPQAQMEKLLAESLRTLGQVCAKVADLIEAQRLERQGYSQQNHFLRRLDQEQAPPSKKE
ncbi:hypothetical protein STIAU_2208 [Stigmatella aurantiaca DW4/3-1]|uniref:Uncharacterized protein n=2 Tax=Stigmatella aurantiaca (strain DW4/3-1) TaxID=378806 RepID=Q08TZ1_STIAD|nr:hypothetical protein STIAU_2208 [Stigmatella aurantiaca DW4/3-1]